MTPKEKAMDIFNQMCNSVDELLPLDVKECALIAVNEILNAIDWDYYEGSNQTEHNYYKEVKKEIENL